MADVSGDGLLSLYEIKNRNRVVRDKDDFEEDEAQRKRFKHIDYSSLDIANRQAHKQQEQLYTYYCSLCGEMAVITDIPLVGKSNKVSSTMNTDLVNIDESQHHLVKLYMEPTVSLPGDCSSKTAQSVNSLPTSKHPATYIVITNSDKSIKGVEEQRRFRCKNSLGVCGVTMGYRCQVIDSGDYHLFIFPKAIVSDQSAAYLTRMSTS